MLRKLILPGLLITPVGIMVPGFLAKTRLAGDRKVQLVKENELPIYDEIQPTSTSSEGAETGLIQSAIREQRLKLFELTKDITIVEDARHYYDIGAAHAQSSLAILMDKENLLLRSAFITSGFILGYILARRGFIRKLLFSTTGLAVTSSMLFPEEARQISLVAANEAEKYSKVAYNFILGVKPESGASNQSK